MQKESAPKLYLRQFIKWTAIGLAIRLVLMPFTMHGQDLVFTNYFPMMFVEKGIWDPYGFISANLPHFPWTYYGPVLFIIMSAANFIFINLFNAVSLVNILEISGTMMFKGLETIDYVRAFSHLELFKNLFLMKIPYLIFDFLTAFILVKLASSQKLALSSYKIWMLNVVVLHSAYAVGGFDISVAFFVAAALYAGVKKRPYLCIVILSLGGAVKLLPYILILPSCLLLGCNWRNRFLLLLTGAIVSVLVFLPFYLSSGNLVLGFFMLPKVAYYSGNTKWILMALFIIVYSFISLRAIKDSYSAKPERKLLYYFIMVIFLNYVIIPLKFRYFVVITPLLALVIPQNKRFGMFILIFISMLAFASLTVRDVQLGLFAPVNPLYFLSLPTIHEIIGSYINIEIIYKILARALLLGSLVSICWVWFIKLNNEQKEGQIQ